ncbi:MAG: 2-oxo acid dehydrogenase subunit E2 [Nitratireductor sp.]
MPINITMPALSPTMEEGNLANWLVKEGDSVSAGDVIAEIETDKATMEVEAVDEGVVAKILVDAGTQGVKVNAVIAVLAEEGEDASSIEAPTTSASATSDASPKAEPVKAASNSDGVKATPLAKRVAEQTGVDLSSLAGSGAKNKIVVSDVRGTTGGTSSAVAADKGDRVFASPLARAKAKEAGLNIADIAGTGPNGRIIAQNVADFVASGGVSTSAGTSATTTNAPANVGADDAKILSAFEDGDYELLPHDGMRRVIAERLLDSTQSIPSYNITMQCELDALLALRSQMNAAAPMVDEKPAFKISVNDFIVKAMAMALQKVPMANAAWSADNRIIHKHSDVGVAVAVPDGLFTPIVRKAELKTLSQISAEVKDMAKRAKNKKLAPHEYSGGSSAVSNLGMFGVDNFTSIINPPHASIVSIGAGQKQAVVKGDEIVAATIMSATFAFDHRVIDGALGAELAKAFKDYIEMPAGMLA